MTGTTNQTDVEQWGIFELALYGSAEGNPFLDAAPLPGKPYQALMLRRVE